MEKRITELSKRLAFLGYDSFQIEYIVKDAVGGARRNRCSISEKRQLISSLEKYVDLGSTYLHAYSK
ncbi:MAG: hypothetical protein P4N41_24720 [Negativicutes bacterium]|nr:hypothetical protein [Negativicutes bacterium]